MSLWRLRPPGSNRACNKTGSSRKNKRIMRPRSIGRRCRIAVVQTKAGEYFGLVDPYGVIEDAWDSLPEGRAIQVQKYDGMYGSQGVEVVIVQKKFRRDYLRLERNSQLAERQLVQNLFSSTFSEELEMSNAKAIIEIAETGDVKKTEEALQSAIGQAVKRAMWVAERNNNFMAIPVLQELDAKYNPGGRQSASVEIKDAKEVKLNKGSSLDDRVWQAILRKANKIGAVTRSTSTVAEINVPKKEADAFVKACQAVKGITVS